MATNKQVLSGFESKWGFLQESTFGTPQAASSNYTIVETSSMPTIDYGVTQVQDIRHRGQRYADKNDTYVTEKSGTRVISFSDWVVRLEDLSELMYAVTQTVSEGATTPFQKDFDLLTSTTQPDFGSSAGYFATLFIDNITAGQDQIFTSCILKTLTLSANTSDGDGRLMASGEWISGFASNNAATLSGTPTFNSQTYYEFSAPATQKVSAAVDQVVKDWEITFTNNAVRTGNDSSGDCESYFLGSYDITGSITLKYDTNSDGFLVDWLAGIARAILLDVGSSGSAGFAQFSMTNAEFTGNEQDYANEVGKLVTLPFKAVGNSSTAGLFNGQIDDANDQTW